MLFIALVLVQLAGAQVSSGERPLYVLIPEAAGTVRAERSMHAGNDRTDRREAYVLQRREEHRELTRLLHRAMKSERSFRLTGWRYYHGQSERRWAALDQYRTEHQVGRLALSSDELHLLLRRNGAPEHFSYRLCGAEHVYSLVRTTTQLAEQLGAMTYALPEVF